jgi:RND family efflux transporter MFP subunit
MHKLAIWRQELIIRWQLPICGELPDLISLPQDEERGDLPMKLKQWGVMLATIILTGCLSGCSNNEPEPEKPAQLPTPVKVSTAKVEKRIANNQVEVVGTVQAVRQAEIAAKITGNINTIMVDLGSRVEQGELLIELSAEEISAQVEQAKAQLEQARRNLAREEKLLKKNAATPQTVKTLRDSARIAEAAYSEATTMQGYSRLTAPFSGVITKKIGNAGDLATPGKPLLYMEAEDSLQVLTDIPEALILQIQKGDSLVVSIPSVDLTIRGIVAEVSPIADPSSRSAPIKLQLAPDSRLRSGQFARVTLTTQKTETLTVPIQAVVPFGQMERVFVVDGNRARLRLVRTGAQSKDRFEILSGLTMDETVITEGNRNLVDGQPITIR